LGRKANRPTDVFTKIKMGGEDECWDYTGRWNERARNCYYRLGGKDVIPYRLVYELVHGIELRSDQLILHSCDNRRCCNPRHMRIGDHAENMQDMRERERHGLPHHTVRAILKLCADFPDLTDAVIASRFGLSRRHVNNIRNGKRYEHIKLTEDGANDGASATGESDSATSDEGGDTEAQLETLGPVEELQVPVPGEGEGPDHRDHVGTGC
jgi:hypothetical protein